MGNLVRFSVAMDDELLMAFDEFVARRGVAVNRSEVIRDLVRDALVDDDWENPGFEVVGTVTMVFSTKMNDLASRLDAIRSSHYESIVSTVRTPLDANECLEVTILRGSDDEVKTIANELLGLKGVRQGRLTTTTTGRIL